MPELRRGAVRLDGRLVAHIEETAAGVRFTYVPDARPVSLTLPVRSQAYEWDRLHPFFENLLPEGWLLDIALGHLQLPESDTIGLMLATCGDCVGAVEIVPEPWPA